MRTNLDFKQESLQEAETYYKTVHMAADQRTVITQVAQFLGQFLPIPERAIKGFIWRVLTEWQVKNHKDLSEVLKDSPSERVEIVSGMFSMLKKQLTRILINQEQEPLLDETFHKAINFYRTKFAGR